MFSSISLWKCMCTHTQDIQGMQGRKKAPLHSDTHPYIHASIYTPTHTYRQRIFQVYDGGHMTGDDHRPPCHGCHYHKENFSGALLDINLMAQTASRIPPSLSVENYGWHICSTLSDRASPSIGFSPGLRVHSLSLSLMTHACTPPPPPPPPPPRHSGW